jgi:hypothetical protein
LGSLLEFLEIGNSDTVQSRHIAEVASARAMAHSRDEELLAFANLKMEKMRQIQMEPFFL